MSLRTLMLGAVALGVGCTGDIGGDEPPKGPTGPVDPTNPLTFECDPTADPSDTDIKRLSMLQYQNTLRDLLAPLGDERDEAFASLGSQMGLVPDDVRDKEHDYVQMDQSVSQSHVDGYYAVGRVFGAQVTATPARTTAFVGACATDSDTSNDVACIDSFIGRFGAQAMRRPLTSDEVAFYRDEIYAVNGPIDPRGIVDLATAMLMSPQFSFQIENGNPAIDGNDDLYTLTGYELASRLSYHFWQTMPDAELFAAAESGELETEGGYEAELERVFADPRTQQAIDDFYAQWLNLDAVPDMLAAVELPDYQAFAGDDLPGPDFREHLLDDTKDLLRYYTWQDDGTFDDLFLSDRAFAKTADIANLYGVAAWDGESDPGALPEGQRSGLLTRAAMVANNKKTTRPIMKGAFIRKRLLCDKLELPENMNNMNSNLEVDSNLSTRQRVEALTEQPGSQCAGCHLQLNPLGYATENFDALGRAREKEILYDADGNVLAEVAVDTSALPSVTTEDERVAADAIDMSEYIVDSTKAHACFARHYFRFSTGKQEDFAKDGCLLERLRVQIVEGGSLRAMLRDVALAPEFRLRKQGN